MGHNMFTPTCVTIVGFSGKFCQDYCLQLELHALYSVLLYMLLIYFSCAKKFLFLSPTWGELAPSLIFEDFHFNIGIAVLINANYDDNLLAG